MNLYLRLRMVWLRNLAGDPQHFSHAGDSQFRVLPHDLDTFGHMNNGRYRQHYGEDSEEYADKMLYYWRYDLVDGNLVAARDKLRIVMREDIDANEADAIWPVHMFTDLAHINLQIGDIPRANEAIDWPRATRPKRDAWRVAQRR